jgi:hypothetical protein
VVRTAAITAARGISDFADLDAYHRFVDEASATTTRAAARRCRSGGQAQVTACHRANRGRRRHVLDSRHVIHARLVDLGQ